MAGNVYGGPVALVCRACKGTQAIMQDADDRGLTLSEARERGWIEVADRKWLCPTCGADGVRLSWLRL